MSIEHLITARTVSPNRNSPRSHAIDRITPHCVVGQVSAQWLAEYFSQPSVGASCNWGIGRDGDLAQVVPEGDRSWCSSSPENDHRAVTIECASDASEPYAVNGKVWDTLVLLCADICQRNGKEKLLWLGDKAKSLAYIPKPGEMVITVHRWFANKSCPGDYIYNRLGLLAEQVNKIIGKKEEPALTEDRVRAIAQEEIAKKNPVYKTLEDIPGYWREDVKALVDAGIIKGTGGNAIDLTRSEARMAVLIKRAMGE